MCPTQTRDDQVWYMQFDEEYSCEGNGANIIFFSPSVKPHQFSFRFHFECMNNVTKFEALSLGLQKALELRCLLNICKCVETQIWSST